MKTLTMAVAIFLLGLTADSLAVPSRIANTSSMK